ncbi:MAG: STAS domain-containing protein [Halocynthiibacter sp.]
MDLSSEISDKIQIITVNDTRIDAAVAVQFKNDIRALADEDIDRLILNLEHVAFLDSSGLGAVVATLKLLNDRCSFELAGLTETVAKVFRLTRMDMVFTIHENAADAAHSQQ